MQQFWSHAARDRNVILLGNPAFDSTLLTYPAMAGLR
jgi:hypothetical protein